MDHLLIPPNYRSALNLHDTQIGIKTVKDFFQNLLAERLHLLRVSAPLFVEPSSGLNDNLNGVERPVVFGIKEQNDAQAEIVHSLAKWKRFALHKYGFSYGEGLYTDMSAIRRDEQTDNIHSIYVDQWDWEKIIAKDERNVKTLEDTVRRIFKVIKHMENEVWYKYPEAVNKLPDDIFFITTQELEDMYPELTPEEREDKICQEHGAVFLMQIGGTLKSGKKHDGRAPDYDDWSLNGDILFWYEPLNCRLELSSMGIRVDEDSMLTQLEAADALDRKQLPYHQMILNKELPYTIGGGIGQSRLCMLLLGKAHVGEVQASIWPKEMIETCRAHNINIL